MHSRLAAVCLLAALLLAAALYIQIAPQVPETIEAVEGDATVFFQLDDTTFLSDSDCVRATWRVEHIQSVRFEGLGVTGEGAGQVCDWRGELEVRFQDGSDHTYQIEKQIFADHLPVRLALVACVGLLILGLLLSPLPDAVRTIAQSRWLQPVAQWLPGPFEKGAARHDALVLWALTGLILLGAAIRTIYLAAPIRSDEAWTYLSFASQPLPVALSEYSSTNNHLFHTLLVHISTALWGLHPWSLRLPAFLAGILIIPVTYQAARQFYGQSVGVAAAGLMAGLSYVIEWSTLARGYPLVTLFFLLLLLTANSLRKRATRRRWFLFVLFSTLGLYTIPIMIYPLAVVGAWLGLVFLRQTDGARRLRALRDLFLAFVVAGIATLLLYLPAILYVLGQPIESLDVEHLNPVVWHSFFSGLTYEIQLFWSHWNRDLPGWLTGLLVLGAGISLLFHAKMARYPVHWAIPIVGALTPILFIPLVTTYARLWIFLLPLYLTLGAAGVMYLVRLFVRSRQVWRGGAVAAAFGLAVFLAGATVASDAVIFSREGTRSIGAEGSVLAIRQMRQADEPVLCVGLCLAHQLYGLMYDVPVVTGLESQPVDEPYFVIVYLDRDQHALEPALERLGYDPAAIGSTEMIYELVDTAAYTIQPR